MQLIANPILMSTLKKHEWLKDLSYQSSGRIILEKSNMAHLLHVYVKRCAVFILFKTANQIERKRCMLDD